MNSDLSTAKTRFDLGRNLLICRKALGLSHLELVSHTGLTRPIVSTIENGTANPTLETILKISTFVNINIDMLLMSEFRFNQLKKLLKSTFEREKYDMHDIHIAENEWKLLLNLSGNASNKNCGKIAKICQKIISSNYTELSSFKKREMVLLATLGIAFQKDGFKNGLEFGVWLGAKSS